MVNKFKIVTIILMFCFATYFAFADRGGFGRNNRIHLNITTISSLKNSIPFNLKSGLSYNGSTILYKQQIGNSIYANSIISYQKGNTIYILPYKQKFLIQSYSPSSGYKLIIRSK